MNIDAFDNVSADSIETQPVSAFEVSPAEIQCVVRKAQAQDKAAAKQSAALKEKADALALALTDLSRDAIKAKRELDVAKRLAKVRNTDPAVLEAQEEALAHLQCEMDDLQAELAQTQDAMQALQNQRKRTKLLSQLGDFDFNLGTTRPSLGVQLLSGLRRNLVYRQRYCEDQIDNLEDKIRRSLDMVNYTHGIAGLDSQHEIDREKITDLEDELTEIYALQEVTGLLYDKLADLLPEHQSNLLKWSPKDAITIEAIRREAANKAATEAEVRAEIAQRKALDRDAQFGRANRAYR